MSEWVQGAGARRVLMVDGHADTAQRFLDEGWAFGGELGGGMLGLDAARRGGLGAEFFAVWVDPGEWVGQYARRALALTDAVLEQVRRCAELQLCVRAEEVEAAFEAGRFGVLLGLEGGHAIENDLGLLRTFYRLGVRYMTLTWSHTTDWADSSGDVEEAGVARHGGLTAFGREVVGEMNRLGMMVDVSHAADETFRDVLEVSRAPVMASHSSARALTGARRNLTDAQLRALAERGGVAMVNFFPAFVDDGWRQAWEASRVERQARQAEAARPFRESGRAVPFAVSNAIDREFAGRIGRVPLAALIDHFDHMMRVAGAAHVGIGSDFDGIPALPEGIDSAADLGRIAEALEERGWGTGEIDGVLGENVLRVMRDVERMAGG